MSVAIYEFGAQNAIPQFQGIVENANYPSWLNDSHRLLFTLAGTLYLADLKSNTTREIFAPAVNEATEYSALAPDNRTIYYSLSTTEADVWLMTLKQN